MTSSVGVKMPKKIVKEPRKFTFSDKDLDASRAEKFHEFRMSGKSALTHSEVRRKLAVTSPANKLAIDTDESPEIDSLVNVSFERNVQTPRTPKLTVKIDDNDNGFVDQVESPSPTVLESPSPKFEMPTPMSDVPVSPTGSASSPDSVIESPTLGGGSSSDDEPSPAGSPLITPPRTP